MAQSMVLHCLLVVLWSNMLLPTCSIHCVISPQPRKQLIKTGYNMVPSLALQSECLSRTFYFSDTIIMVHVEHWSSIYRNQVVHLAHPSSRGGGHFLNISNFECETLVPAPTHYKSPSYVGRRSL